MINYIALLVALALSGVSGYYSIIGLTAIFSSAFYPIIFMGGVLEAGKLVTASWLYNNWSDAPRVLKYYLTIIVVVLMFITSMGIFGFLSKAHIEQSLAINTGTADQIQILDSKINFEKQSIADLDKQIAQIDAAIAKMTDRGQASNSLRAATQQRKTRDTLVKRKEDLVKNISEYNTQKIRLQSEVKKLEAEVGPIKYIAELLYDKTDSNQLEKAVRLVIIILVLVFDPLAVVLLIAANFGLKNKKIKLTSDKEVAILEIDNKVLTQGERNVTKRKIDKKQHDRSYRKSRRKQDLHKKRHDPNISANDKRGIERFC